MSTERIKSNKNKNYKEGVGAPSGRLLWNRDTYLELFVFLWYSKFNLVEIVVAGCISENNINREKLWRDHAKGNTNLNQTNQMSVGLW